MRRQLDSMSEDLTETSRSKDIALRENRRLQDDLGVMTKENQVNRMLDRRSDGNKQGWRRTLFNESYLF